MSASYFHLSCDLQQNFFSGFSRLQEQEEFVDMTLAADGRLVKVHKNIMALASPYIKDILKTSPSDNQVIYLHNVSHNLLTYLLEYIYQGETNIPYGSLETFMQLAQSLRIIGMNKPETPMADRVNQDPGLSYIEKQLPKQQENASFHHVKRSNNVAASLVINDNHNLEVQQFEENKHIPDIAEITYSHLSFATCSETKQNINLGIKIDKSLENSENSMEVDNPSVPSLQTLANNVSSYPKIETQELSGSKECQNFPTVPENTYSNTPLTIQVQPLTTSITGNTGLIDLNNVSSYPRIEIQALSGSKECQTFPTVPENTYSNAPPTIQIQPLTTNTSAGTGLIDLNNVSSYPRIELQPLSGSKECQTFPTVPENTYSNASATLQIQPLTTSSSGGTGLIDLNNVSSYHKIEVQALSGSKECQTFPTVPENTYSNAPPIIQIQPLPTNPNGGTGLIDLNNVSSYPRLKIQALSGSKECQTFPTVSENSYSVAPPILQMQPLTTNPTGGTGLYDLKLDKESRDALKIITQYTVTERGSVEIIVSRYIYYSHHNSCGGRKHRWRCIDYRKTRCPAFIDSLDRTIVQRKGVHTHGFHDDKIYKKHEKGLIFPSFEQANKVKMLPDKPVPYDDIEESADNGNSSTFKIISVTKM